MVFKNIEGFQKISNDLKKVSRASMMFKRFFSGNFKRLLGISKDLKDFKTFYHI